MFPVIGAYYAIHYGLDYLAYSLESIYDAVDMIGIFYSQLPSHGHRSTPLENPDSPEAIRATVRGFPDPQGKIKIIEADFRTEAEHRNQAARTMFEWGAQQVLVVDSDEVWDPDSLAEGLARAWFMVKADLVRVNFVHFWRSFNWVCRDSMMPVRIQRAVAGPSVSMQLIKPVYHFGYAQRPEMVRYKASIHGHRAEWRNGWFEEKFLAWSPLPPDGSRVSDVHPTAGGIWYPARFDKTELPEVMREHPYWDKELIV